MNNMSKSKRKKSLEQQRFGDKDYVFTQDDAPLELMARAVYDGKINLIEVDNIINESWPLFRQVAITL